MFVDEDVWPMSPNKRARKARLGKATADLMTIAELRSDSQVARHPTYNSEPAYREKSEYAGGPNL